MSSEPDAPKPDYNIVKKKNQIKNHSQSASQPVQKMNFLPTDNIDKQIMKSEQLEVIDLLQSIKK